MSDASTHAKSFLEKYRIAKNANSREIRLTMQEAEQLQAAIACMLVNELDMAKRIIELQDQINSAELSQDGGSF